MNTFRPSRLDIDEAKGRRKRVNRVLVLTKRVAPTPIFSKVAIAYTKRTGARGKLDKLFREAIKAETGATRVKITPNEVFITLSEQAGWQWIGARDGVEDLILRPQSDRRLRGSTEEAATYRKAMGSSCALAGVVAAIIAAAFCSAAEP